MSCRRFFWLPLVCAAALSASDAQDLPAVLSRDAEVVIDVAGKQRTTVKLEKGREIKIVPDLSNDEELYVSSISSGAEFAGWVDRDAVSWPDGSSIPGTPDDMFEHPRQPASKGSSRDKKKESASHAKGKKSKKGSSSKSKKEAKAAQISKAVKDEPETMPEPQEPARHSVVELPSKAAPAERSLHEMLLGLVVDSSTQEYAATVVKDASLSKEEKLQALKLFNRYLQEKRSRLRTTGADEAQRSRLQKESEDLLESLASLDGKPAQSAPKLEASAGMHDSSKGKSSNKRRGKKRSSRKQSGRA